MRLRPIIGVGLSAVAVAGCGGGGAASRRPQADSLPLVRGATVVQRVRVCDRSANAFCAVELVVQDPSAGSSGVLAARERRRLHQLGWTSSDGDIPSEQSAESPGGKLRVTFSAAADDLLGIDLGWIKRPLPVTLALSRSMFQRVPAISIMLETGPA